MSGALANKTKLIGVLGGMGPEATAHFFLKLIKHTPAKEDQDHFRILVYNNPKIPDRTKAILGKGESPLQSLVASALLLQNAGADFIVIPCVSSHYFFGDIQDRVNVPLLNLVHETATFIQERYRIERVGLLATAGTVRAKLFETAFCASRIKIMTPEKRDQELLMEALYGSSGIKAGLTTGEPKEKVLRVAARLIHLGAETIIGGCTEIPLVINDSDVNVPLVDTLEVLALATIRKAMNE